MTESLLRSDVIVALDAAITLFDGGDHASARTLMAQIHDRLVVDMHVMDKLDVEAEHGPDFVRQ